MTPNFRVIPEEKAHYIFLMGFPRLILFLPDEYEIQQVLLNSDLQIHKSLFFRAGIRSVKLCIVHVNIFLSSLKIPIECKNRTVISVPKIHLCIYYELLASYRNTIHVNLTSTDLFFLNGFIYLDCVLHTI